MGKYIIGGIAIVLLIGGGFWAWKTYGTAEPVVDETPEVVVPTTNTYATSTFSVSYPKDFTADDTHTYTGFGPGKAISGVKFTIPGTMATGTNLSADSYVSVEWLPRAKKCTADIYLLANVRGIDTVIGGTSYSVATSSGAAAGNRYDEEVYAFPSSSPCTAVRYFVHTTQLENYPEGTVREFDRSALIRAFDEIRDSLLFTPSSSTSTTTP